MSSLTGDQAYSFNRWPPALAPGFCLFDACFVAFALWMVFREVSFESRAQLVDGQVVRFVQRTDARRCLPWAAIFFAAGLYGLWTGRNGLKPDGS
jgi:hypothetical protein